jgi:hypothetical protein
VASTTLGLDVRGQRLAFVDIPKFFKTPREMIPLEGGEVLHARQMTLNKKSKVNYPSLIVVVLAILEALHIHPSVLVNML